MGLDSFVDIDILYKRTPSVFFLLYNEDILKGNNEKLLIDSFFLFQCLCVSILFQSLVEIKIEIQHSVQFIVLIYMTTTV